MKNKIPHHLDLDNILSGTERNKKPVHELIEEIASEEKIILDKTDMDLVDKLSDKYHSYIIDNAFKDTFELTWDKAQIEIDNFIRSGSSKICSNASKELARIKENVEFQYLKKKYRKNLSDGDIAWLIAYKVPPSIASRYSKKFNSQDIYFLLSNGIYPNAANSLRGYSKRFSVSNTILMAKNGIDRKANYYDSDLAALDICILSRIGIDSKISHNNDDLKRVVFYVGTYYVLHDLKNDTKLIGTGASGIIILSDHKATKFSLNVLKEYKMLKKIDDAHNHLQKNVVKVIGSPMERIKAVQFGMEYIKGNTLEQLIKKNNFNSKNIAKFCSEIINGLQELLSAGIYAHRDIRPANIMIDEEKDRAVIIDLGIATINPKFKPKNNRRYGGPHDLVSVGQIMYKMATGRHIFAKSKSMERTTYAEELEDERNKAYSDPYKYKQYLKKVEKNIKDYRIRAAILLCLDPVLSYDNYDKVAQILKED